LPTGESPSSSRARSTVFRQAAATCTNSSTITNQESHSCVFEQRSASVRESSTSSHRKIPVMPRTNPAHGRARLPGEGLLETPIRPTDELRGSLARSRRAAAREGPAASRRRRSPSTRWHSSRRRGEERGVPKSNCAATGASSCSPPVAATRDYASVASLATLPPSTRGGAFLLVAPGILVRDMARACG
jgi:hypothetical protein